MTTERILIADDEPQVLRFCSRALTQKGYRVQAAGGGQEALTYLPGDRRSGTGFDLLVVDIKMPEVDGLTVLRRARELDPSLNAVVISGYGTIENAIEAMNAGARRFVLKPFGVDELVTAVQETLAEREKEQELLRLRAQVPILELGHRFRSGTPQALMAEGDVPELSRRLLKVVVQQTGTERALIALRDEKDGELYVAAAIGLDDVGVGLRRDLLQKDLLQKDLLQKDLLQKDLLQGLLQIPLRTAQKEIGTLFVGGVSDAEIVSDPETLSEFTPSTLNLLSILGRQIAMALENARLFDQVDRASREWNATFDAIADGISIHDANFRLVRANRALAERLGMPAEALVGQTCYTLFHQADAPIPQCPHAQALSTAQPYTAELEEPALGGVFRVSAYPLLDDQGQVTASVHILQDITKQKLFQAQLVQSEKLAALGRLAASLAHEINNPLQALRSGLGLLASRSFEEEKRQRYLQVASHEVERLISITEQMLGFYRPSAEQRAPIDVNQVLDDTLVLASKKLQHGKVTIRRRLAPRLPPVEAVADQLRQVFLNILLNALDAMPEGGELTVASGFDLQRREEWISFTDTGKGILTENISRIFEPLYSTKPRGTGLGLAVSYGIVERHGGRIEVESQVGEGSRFTVFLPTGDV